MQVYRETKMPKRDEQQRQKRNETRRKLKKLSRKAIFCLQHSRNTQPDVYKEATDLYEYLNALYPNKHDLTRTQIYQKSLESKTVKEQVRKHAKQCTNTNQNREVKPLLEIALMPQTTKKETLQEQATDVGMQLPTLAIEEMDTLVKDLQEDPDLKHFFNVQFNTELGGSKSKTIEEEIDEIIQQEFEALGAELADLTNVDYELMCLEQHV